jgi:DNA-binding transcriptional LysR family regulator
VICMDLDLRKLRYFVAVAEHLNFGRPRSSYTSPGRCSPARFGLEQELTVKLFVRGNRGTELTAAGQALLEDARHLLPAADAARRRTIDANTGIGFSPWASLLARSTHTRRDSSPSAGRSCRSRCSGSTFTTRPR